MKTEVLADGCPFCEFVSHGTPVLDMGAFVARYDLFPVSPGHLLLITRRHVPSLFDLNMKEWRALRRILSEAQALLDQEFQPDAYNVGVNVGAAAGQTIMHVHIHVIPRYHGDVEHPEGGVRGVIPGKARYKHLEMPPG